MKFNIKMLPSLVLASIIIFSTSEISLSQIVEIDKTSKTSVSTNTGDITFDNLSLSKKNDLYDYLEMSGIVHNLANKKWNESSYLVTFYDIKGNYLSDLCFFIDSLNKNETKKISSKLYSHDGSPELQAKDLKKVGSYKIKLLSGNFDAIYNIKLRKSIPEDNLIYEDNYIHINWVFSEEKLAFALSNKTDNPINIDWNQVSYIDTYGDAHKVIHKNVKYLEKDNHLTSTLIPPTARINDIILPADHVNYAYDRWRETPMFPEGEQSKMYEGKSFSVFIPMEVNGEVKNYTFTFDISEVSY